MSIELPGRWFAAMSCALRAGVAAAAAAALLLPAAVFAQAAAAAASVLRSYTGLSIR